MDADGLSAICSKEGEGLKTPANRRLRRPGPFHLCLTTKADFFSRLSPELARLTPGRLNQQKKDSLLHTTFPSSVETSEGRQSVVT